MNIQDFLAIAIVGAAISLVMEFIGAKTYSPSLKKLIVVGLSLIVGGFYVWIQSTPYFQTFCVILGAASTVYALALKK